MKVQQIMQDSTVHAGDIDRPWILLCNREMDLNQRSVVKTSVSSLQKNHVSLYKIFCCLQFSFSTSVCLFDTSSALTLARSCLLSRCSRQSFFSRMYISSGETQRCGLCYVWRIFFGKRLGMGRHVPFSCDIDPISLAAISC